jgi:hypothetical protein
MLRRILIMTVLLATCTTAVFGQSEDETSMPFVYGIYFECDVAREDLADEIMELVMAPIWDAAVEDGTISSWGWLSHHTGGKWRRLIYHTAHDLDGLFSALTTVNGSINQRFPEMGRAFSEICGTHEDYVWHAVTGSRGGNVETDRGGAGFSVYLECDTSREDRADEIIEETFTPIFDRQVSDGRLMSWAWMERVIGGGFRRAWTLSAADHSSLLAAWTAINREMAETSPDESREFDSICGTRQDYMWNIVHETP